ncbi:hypothetical protein AOL_s00004g158 [Orbilia oligospora ATCC 24927]|uniref:C2H2-type domain-containing protein n=1 Tax=Arthrobotrys oligospora (strain ATCC 24927 / CBS 115.81 / DSM 1491) TaxID=756982 RepID=G1WXZ8_ARTOA|nr:hypothetical protein AOL_s00004g158 [Orbilia oligospora ATCC 24927]EGX54125.1 hypothetical protein AOL_s00004g158 [Orbilia oligospora ATCC 24927]
MEGVNQGFQDIGHDPNYLDPFFYLDFDAPADPAGSSDLPTSLAFQDDSNFISSFMATLPGYDSASLQDSLHTTPADNPANPSNDTPLTSSDKRKKKTPSKAAGQRAKRKISNSYTCPKCNGKVSSLRALGDHMRDVHKMKGFKCDNCETRVTRYDNLESHKRTCRSHTTVVEGSTAPTTGRPHKKRGQRVNLLNIALRPEPMRSLPRPSSQGNSEGTMLIIPLLEEAQQANTTPPSHVHMSQLSNQGNDIAPGSNNPPPDLKLKGQGLKAQLVKTMMEHEKARWEVYNFRQHHPDLWETLGDVRLH